ncbi:MAG TPA: protein-disulfide reductase DsbD N-terminal domain-containing protein [Acidobacteriaceae bacterium]
MKRIRLLLLSLAISAPLPAQLGNMSAPPPPKAYVAYTALPHSIAANHAATLELHFRVLPGYHVNSHKPTLDYLIPTALTVPPAAGLKPGEPTYPSGQPYAFAFDPKNKLSVYAGDFIVKLPVTAAPGSHSIDASLRYQACNNASCFPPKNLPVKIDFTAK